jgi:hypothetical protein
VSFVSFSENPIARLIADAGDAAALSLVVGAGASMEAGLPSWETLVRNLVRRAAAARNLIDVDDAESVERWEAEAGRDGYLGAAAIAEALSEGDRDAWIAEELFGPTRGPADFFPGPISRQVPVLRRAFGTDLRVMTTNYDDLLEQAFRDDGAVDPIALATGDHHVPAGGVAVFHLHGYLGRDGADQGDLVLSEADYQRMQQAPSWQEDLVRTALRSSTVVFVGTSLIDPNLIRYLHGVLPQAEASCFAVFVRQGTYPIDVPAGIPPAREEALVARWEALGVVPVFVDHYVDVAQVLYEIARRREDGDDGYVPLADRAAEWVGVVQNDILGVEDDTAFRRGQETTRDLLRTTLDQAVAAVEELEGDAFDETMACSLWLVDRAGEVMTNWVTTDRLHVDRETIDPVPIDEHSRWVAVRAYCRGTPLAEPRDIYASRWHFIRGTPLTLDTERQGRIPLGCLTTASMKGRNDSRLATMAADVQAEFNQALSEPILRFLDRPFGAGE